MWDTCLRLLPGHRLRVEIACSAFPKFDVNLGTGGDKMTATEGVIAHNVLHRRRGPAVTAGVDGHPDLRRLNRGAERRTSAASMLLSAYRSASHRIASSSAG